MLIAAATLSFAAFTVTLDGHPVLPRARTAVVGGRILLPVRAVGRALAADVAYDGAARRISLQRGAHVAYLPARGAVRIVAGRAYAPLRALADALGVGVGYDARARTVALDDRSLLDRVPAAPSMPPVPADVAPRATAQSIGGLRPADGAVVHDPYPTIAARVDGLDALDRASLRLIIDGRDVSADASVVGNVVTYTPRRALPPGEHAVALYAGTLSRHWAFGDDFVFATPPPGTFAGPVVEAIYFDRYVGPGTNAFDLIVRGAPGLIGAVAVDGVGVRFPLQVYTADAYVAHVVLPPGFYQPFARVAVRLTLPGGDTRTIVLPQTLQLQTGPPPSPTPTPTPTPKPVVRPLPSLTPAPVVRPLPKRSPSPAPTPTAAATPSALPATAPSPDPSAAPPAKKRVPLKRRPTPTPEP